MKKQNSARKTLGAFSLLSLFITATSAWAQSTPVGKWRTIDDKTGKAKSVIEIAASGDELKGKIIEVIDPEKQNAKCDKCEGDKKDAPVLGLELLWGLRETEPGKEWSGGKILDPENGKTYKVLMRPKDNGEKLEVRGYIGFSLIGRTQTWERVKTDLK